MLVSGFGRIVAGIAPPYLRKRALFGKIGSSPSRRYSGLVLADAPLRSRSSAELLWGIPDAGPCDKTVDQTCVPRKGMPGFKIDPSISPENAFMK
jgi:hypothetical protein